MCDRQGESATLSPNSVRELNRSAWSCAINQHAAKPLTVPCSILLDVPFHALMRCDVSLSLLDSQASAELQLMQDGRLVSVQRLCRATTPSTKHTVSICTQPLFSPPNSPQADHQEHANAGSPRARFRALVWQWLEYNFMIGVDHVYLYDRDGSFGELVHLFGEHRITRILWPPFNKQFAHPPMWYDQQLAQNACLMRHRSASEWLLFVDPDEFVHFGPAMQRPSALQEFLNGQSQDVAQVRHGRHCAYRQSGAAPVVYIPGIREA